MVAIDPRFLIWLPLLHPPFRIRQTLSTPSRPIHLKDMAQLWKRIERSTNESDGQHDVEGAVTIAQRIITVARCLEKESSSALFASIIPDCAALKYLLKRLWQYPRPVTAATNAGRDFLDGHVPDLFVAEAIDGMRNLADVFEHRATTIGRCELAGIVEVGRATDLESFARKFTALLMACEEGQDCKDDDSHHEQASSGTGYSTYRGAFALPPMPLANYRARERHQGRTTTSQILLSARSSDNIRPGHGHCHSARSSPVTIPNRTCTTRACRLTITQPLPRVRMGKLRRAASEIQSLKRSRMNTSLYRLAICLGPLLKPAKPLFWA